MATNLYYLNGSLPALILLYSWHNWEQIIKYSSHGNFFLFSSEVSALIFCVNILAWKWGCVFVLPVCCQQFSSVVGHFIIYYFLMMKFGKNLINSRTVIFVIYLKLQKWVLAFVIYFILICSKDRGMSRIIHSLRWKAKICFYDLLCI